MGDGSVGVGVGLGVAVAVVGVGMGVGGGTAVSVGATVVAGKMVSVEPGVGVDSRGLVGVGEGVFVPGKRVS